MRTKNQLVALVLTLMCGSIAIPRTAVAQDRFASLPGADRYSAVNKAVQAATRAGGRIGGVEWDVDNGVLLFSRSGDRFQVDLATGELSEAAEASSDRGGRGGARGARRPRRGHQRDVERSPDGHWDAVCQDWNVILKRTDDLGGEIIVTADGTRKKRYGKASWVYGEELRQTEAMWWSPDSAMLAFYEFDERDVPDYYLLDGWTEKRTEPEIEGYPKPGDPNPRATLRVFHLEDRSLVECDVNVEEDHYIYNVRFAPDGSVLLVSRTNRLQNVLEILAVDPGTGEARVVVREEQEAWQSNLPTMRFLEDQRRFIWGSESSGYHHLQLRSLDHDRVVELTRGHYPVSSIAHIDEDRNELYYTAFSTDHALNAMVHRVGLDGRGDVRLTEPGLNHSVTGISPDGDWVIVRAQAIDVPPRTLLLDRSGTMVATLAESDTSALESIGLQPPEMFTCKAADGTTDLYGWVYKPSDFDPSRSYPLVIDVYGGPLSQGVFNNYRPAYPHTEFGFIIAKIDNRGTRGRGKAFEAATYEQLGTVDLADQVAGIKYLSRRPYIDPQRVGVFGHSYGGYMAALAILKHPQTFSVAVAGAPVTDWRNYDSIYTERFMGLPDANETGYDDGSCMTFADQLDGKLLLMHGMMDDNVHPSNTWQLVDALQKAGKSFDLKIYPNAMHGLGRGSTAIRWEYLYEHLIERPASGAQTDY